MAEKLPAARDLLLEELKSILYVEQTLATEVLPELHEQVDNLSFRRGVAEHLEQTHDHVARIERVFELLDATPEPGTSPAFDGLRRQRAEVLGKVEQPELRDLFNAGAAAHTEHYEISAYHGLITLASTVGEPEAVRLLEQNLHDEEDALAKVEKRIPEELTTQVVAG